MPGEEVADEVDGAGLLDVGVYQVVIPGDDACRGGVEGLARVEGGPGEDAFHSGYVCLLLAVGKGAPKSVYVC